MSFVAISELHSQRLRKARATARTHIVAWRKLLSVARAAEEKAECPLNLPKVLVNRIDPLEQRVKSADYLTTLEIDKEAVSAQEQLFAIANQVISQKLKAEQTAVAAANENANAAVRERDYKLRDAQSTRDSAQLAKRPQVGASVGAGCGVGVIALIAGMILQAVSRPSEPLYMFGGLIGGCFGFLGWVTVPIILFTLWAVKLSSQKTAADAVLSASKSDAEQTYKKNLAQITLDLKYHTDQRDKANAALTLLTSLGR